MSTDERSTTAKDAADETTDETAKDAAEETTDEVASAASGAVDTLSQAAGDAATRAGAAAQRAGEVVADVAGTAAATMQARAPQVIDASRTTAGIAYEQVQKASNDQLLLGTAFAAGAVTGLIFGRVPRLLVLAALIPVAVFGGTLLGRRRGSSPTTSRTTKGR